MKPVPVSRDEHSCRLCSRCNIDTDCWLAIENKGRDCERYEFSDVKYRLLSEEYGAVGV